MAPLAALVLGTLAARLVGWLGVAYVDGWPAAVAIGLALMFVVTGIAHFVNPLRRDLIASAPRLPSPDLLVTATGVLELLGAAGLLYPPTRAAAAVALGVMMLAMFPANVYAARMPSPPKSMTTQLPLRTVEQIVFVGAALVVGLGGVNQRCDTGTPLLPALVSTADSTVAGTHLGLQKHRMGVGLRMSQRRNPFSRLDVVQAIRN